MVRDRLKLSFHWKLALRWDREAEGQTSHQRPPAPVFSEFSCCTSFLCLKLLAREAATTLGLRYSGQFLWTRGAGDAARRRRAIVPKLLKSSRGARSSALFLDSLLQGQTKEAGIPERFGIVSQSGPAKWHRTWQSGSNCLLFNGQPLVHVDAKSSRCTGDPGKGPGSRSTQTRRQPWKTTRPRCKTWAVQMIQRCSNLAPGIFEAKHA